MKHIAVVGLKDTNQFHDWAYEKQKCSKKLDVGRSWAVDMDKCIWYYCILCSADIGGRVFDDIIECDPLRLELRLRLKNDEE